MGPFQRIFEADDASVSQVGDPIRGDIDEPDTDGSFEAFRQAWQHGADLPDLFGKRPLDIKAPVTPFGPHRKADLAKLETFLDRTGHLDLKPTEGPTGQPSIRLDDAIRDFQAERGLHVDGVVNPEGETHRELSAALKPTVMAARGGPTKVRPATAVAQPDGKRPTLMTRQLAQVPNETVSKPKGPTHRQAERESKAKFDAPQITHRGAERESGVKLKRLQRLERAEKNAKELLKAAETTQTMSRRGRLNPLTSNIHPRVEIPNGIAAFRRYLDGKGGVITYDPQWVLEHRILRRSANRNEWRYGRWLLADPTDSDKREKDKIWKALQGLKEGQSLTIGKRYQARFDLTPDRFSDHRLVFGRGLIHAKGSFKFTRKGNIIEVVGHIEQRIDDPFDFEPGKVFDFKFAEIKTDDLIFLEKFGNARVFINRSVWKRRVKARIRIQVDPKTGEIIKIIGFSEAPSWSDAR